MIPKAITEDLRNGMGLEECLIKHETNLKTLFNREYYDDNRFNPENKYIEKRGIGYHVKKKIKCKTYYFGKYSSLEDARKVRDKLIINEWKQNQVDNICKELNIQRLPSRNEKRYYE